MPIHIPITDQSVTYSGHSVTIIDTYDGEAGDPEYVNYEYTTNIIEWSES